MYGYEIGHPDEDLSFDERDSAGSMPKCVVIDPAFTWGEDRRPETPWNRTVIYETHVKGLTKLHPSIPPEISGTYLALAHDPVLEHLRSLGVTAVELLPVHQFVDDRRPRRARPLELLGLQLDRVLRARTTRTRRARSASRSTSSSRW